MNKNEFVLALKNLGIDITEEKLNKLDKYYDLLIEWNNKINLTRITGKEEVYLKHFYDSLCIVKVIDLSSLFLIFEMSSYLFWIGASTLYFVSEVGIIIPVS